MSAERVLLTEGRPAYAAVIGDPVAHSLSPAIHNAAFAALGIDARYEALTVAVGAVPDAVRRLRDERWLGMSVTMPHKETVVGELDALTPIAERLGAVNCVFWESGVPGTGRLVGDNTDGAGVVWSLRTQLGVEDLGRRIAVVGAGGAAKACIAALAAAGAVDIAVVNRTVARAEQAAALAPGVARVGTIDDLPHAEIVINATPVGMIGTDGGALGFVPGATAVALDLVYHPLETAWLARARANGARAANGVGMLVGQAAAAFERWTGRPAPTEAMLAAVADALAD